MWYRIELNKDGSVASCMEVEACISEGRNVRYVEADSRGAALKLVAAWWRRKAKDTEYYRKRAEAARLAGACSRCRIRPRAGGAKTCAACADQNKKLRDAYHTGARVKSRRKDMTDDERAAAAQRRLVSMRNHMAGERALCGGGNPKKVRRVALEQVLAKFDELSPAAFRSWVQDEIAKLKPAR
jgi:hypothetical protein